MTYGFKRWSMGYGCGIALGVSMATNFSLFPLGIAVALWLLDFLIVEETNA